MRPIFFLARASSWRQYWTSSSSHPTQKVPIRKLLLEKIPQRSWDSHMHVVDPTQYPLAEEAQYTPEPHLLSEALAFESTLGIQKIVLVQPSIYGHDNSCMLDALRRLGPQNGRAVVTFDPKSITPRTLDVWHRIGVRGVRINLQSVGQLMDPVELTATLQQYADIIRPYDWVLQLYVPLNTATVLETVVPKLGVKVCLDHFGCPTLSGPAGYHFTGDPYSLPGFTSLVNLLSQGSTYLKMSAPYRLSPDAGHLDLEPMAKELLRVAPNRVVFATDWPHTRYEGLDIKPFVESVVEWCGDDNTLIERIFKYNAEDLWSVSYEK
ncbi:hypothetical protein V495_06112 [Pseudogymnoascus sp. VKM F-4514 (FW-929)]|nr:hypothetical protein V495_06112 [Pseudogymnoascus sp. VKM F-4514 (FW-929)]KFY55476.1 hypothetical protein V497_06939 [Pseudogymnoascus sp. VKM F-4516 (FW-969)]